MSDKMWKNRPPRLARLDELRGLALLSMLAYHAAWDLVWMFGVRWPWYTGLGAYLWQQATCWTFILLSGFCLPLGRRPVRRGAVVFAGGAVISAATFFFMSSSQVWFGVLTLTGSAMLLTGALDRWLRRVPPWAGLAVSAALFVLTRNVNEGWLGFEGWRLCPLPAALYANMGTAWLGFPPARFYSTDYFSLVPWLFLFWAGYFGQLWVGRARLTALEKPLCPPLGWLGRHTLEVYMLHQPLLYAAMLLLMRNS